MSVWARCAPLPNKPSHCSLWDGQSRWKRKSTQSVDNMKAAFASCNLHASLFPLFLSLVLPLYLGLYPHAPSTPPHTASASSWLRCVCLFASHLGAHLTNFNCALLYACSSRHQIQLDLHCLIALHWQLFLRLIFKIRFQRGLNDMYWDLSDLFIYLRMMR